MLRIDEHEGQSADGQDLVGSERSIGRARPMIDVDNVVKHPPRIVPESLSKAGQSPLEIVLPRESVRLPGIILWAREVTGNRQSLSDGKGVEPQHLDLDGFADPRRHDTVTDFGIHPGKLGSWTAASQQAVVVDANAEARAVTVAGQDRRDRRFEPRLIARVERILMAAARLQELADGNHKPQRGVDGVVFGHVAFVRKAIGEHSFGNGAGPGEQNPPGVVQPAEGQGEPAHGDERIAAPIGEPRIPGQDRLAMTAVDEIGVGGGFQRSRESPAALRSACSSVANRWTAETAGLAGGF